MIPLIFVFLPFSTQNLRGENSFHIVKIAFTSTKKNGKKVSGFLKIADEVKHGHGVQGFISR